ncbi:hypothetical protein PS15m_012297 [Mucor circinelloides]
MYHQITPISPSPGYGPQYAQIYFTDPQHQSNLCRGIFSQLQEPVLNRLQEMVVRHSEFAQPFEMTRQRFSQNDQDFHISINGRATATLGRTYAAPTSDEVAAIVINPISTDNPNCVPHLRRDVATFRRNGTVQYMSKCHRSYDPMHYVLMFPEGTNGWHVSMPLHLNKVEDGGDEENEAGNEQDDQGEGEGDVEDSGDVAQGQFEDDENAAQQEVARPGAIIRTAQKNISVKHFYAHRLQVRPSEGMLHYFGRLFHQYIVDMYVKVEHQRLDSSRHNQGSLRSELYKGLTDAVVSDSTTSTEETGKQIILPSSHTGSPRSMQPLYQDSMAMVSTLGKPSYFITFTCNPHWPEIVHELRNGGLDTSDRPNLCARVFDAKLNELIQDIKTKPYIFGNVIGFTHVVEFQKRGLPHAHMVVIVDEDSRPTLENYGKYVSTELPDQTRHPKAYATVARNMMHAPCGKDINSQRPCLDDNAKCTKHHPKPYAKETFIDSKGFVHYRRRSQQRSTYVKFGDYNADNRWVIPHNLYLVTKYDAHINVEICAGVQAIKYLHKYITKGSDKPQIKLNKEQADNATTSSTPATASTSTTTSIKRMQDAHSQNRVKGIGRMYFVPPSAANMKKYCMRLLLLHVRGPQSFDHLKNFNGVQYVTFREAAQSMGLLANENECHFCLDEGYAMARSGSSTVPDLFVTIL